MTAMGDYLIGRFVWRFPGWQAIKTMAKHWNVQYDIQVHKTMWLIFKFQNAEDCDRAMRGGPYVALRCPLYLMPLPIGFFFQREELQRLPI